MEKEEDRRAFWACICVAVSIVITLLAATSCAWIEEPIHRDSIEPGMFTDSWVSGEDRTTVSVCNIQEWMSGETYIWVEVRNTVCRTSTKKVMFEVFYDSYIFPYEFERTLRNLQKEERTDQPITFIANAKGVEISWKMFDEIYKTYAHH